MVEDQRVEPGELSAAELGAVAGGAGTPGQSKELFQQKSLHLQTLIAELTSDQPALQTAGKAGGTATGGQGSSGAAGANYQPDVAQALTLLKGFKLSGTPSADTMKQLSNFEKAAEQLLEQKNGAKGAAGQGGSAAAGTGGSTHAIGEGIGQVAGTGSSASNGQYNTVAADGKAADRHQQDAQAEYGQAAKDVRTDMQQSLDDMIKQILSFVKAAGDTKVEQMNVIKRA